MMSLLADSNKLSLDNQTPVISNTLSKTVNDIKMSVEKFQSKVIDKNNIAYLKITEPYFPVIVVPNKCFLLAVNNKNFCGLIWLADWFEIDSIYSDTGNNCFVNLKIRGNIIKTSYSTFQPKNIVNLSTYGLVINFEYADEMSRYIYKRLSEFEIIQQNNRIGFFEKDGCLMFRGYEDECSLLKYTKDISFEEYTEGLNKLLTNIPLMFALCCSCASIFLAYINMKCDVVIDSFIISIFGKTTTGKSTSQSLMSSVFSTPNSDLIFSPFYGTGNSIIKRVTNRFGIPQIFNEATTNSNINMENLIYTISHEHDKYRCNTSSSLKENDRWKTIIITSSENNLLKETSMHNGGLESRCLSFSNLQYTDSREHSEQIQTFCNKNFGILGKEISNRIIEADAGEISQKYDDCRTLLRNLITKCNTYFDLSERLINKYALILIASETLNSLGIRIDTEGILNIIINNHNEISSNLSSQAKIDAVRSVNWK